MKIPPDKILLIALIAAIGWQQIPGKSQQEIQAQLTAQSMDLKNESYEIIDRVYLKAKRSQWIKTEEVGYRIVTGYSSTPDQCDETPFITASGERVRDGIVASNEFPIGTELVIEGKVYEVQDRTSKKYRYRIDIWFPTREQAKEWGKKILKIEKVIH